MSVDTARSRAFAIRRAISTMARKPSGIVLLRDKDGEQPLLFGQEDYHLRAERVAGRHRQPKELP